jgi:hypothetical protein
MSTEFCSPYGYGKLETSTRFFALDMLKEGLINNDQYEAIDTFIKERLDRINSEIKEYSKNS